jgi:hypothetical protein
VTFHRCKNTTKKIQKVVDKGVARRYNKNKLAIPLANLKEILRETK